MRKAAILVGVISLLVIAFLIFFPTVGQSKESEQALVEVNNQKRVIEITPSGNVDSVVLAEAVAFRGLTFNHLLVGNEKREDVSVIFVATDYDKDIKIVFSNFIGMKVEYQVKIILTHFIKFHIDGEIVDVVSKNKVGSGVGFPSGIENWYTDVTMNTLFDPLKIRDVVSLYGRSA